MTCLGERMPGLHVRNCPVKVELPTACAKRSVITSTHKLKQSGPQFAKIYVKKDIHPAIRKEYDRLRKSERDERSKSEYTPNSSLTVLQHSACTSTHISKGTFPLLLAEALCTGGDFFIFSDFFIFC